jgi:homocitrate synthase NifV
MATANAVAAACAGAHSVDVTVNGLGERAGNAALEEVVMAFEVALGTPTGLKTEQLVGLSQFVARCCGRAIPLSKPIVGTNAFTHESGIHVHALLRNARSYEAFSPERVGHTDRLFVIGKHSGMSAIRHVLRHRQLEVTNVAEQGLLEAVRSRAERHRGHVNPEELVDLVATYTR